MLETWKGEPSDYQIVPYEEPGRSNDCSEQLKTHKIVLAFFAVDTGAAAFAVFCFDKQNMTGGVLNPRTYDYINLAASSAFLLLTAIRPGIKLRDPKEAGVRSYEFSMAAMAVQIVIYSVAFFNTQEQTDFNRSLMYGFSLAMVSAAFSIAGVKHCRAKPSDEKPIPRIRTDYSDV